MGDASDMSDIERFMRSKEGQAHLKAIAVSLRGKRIEDVSFGNDVHVIVTGIHLDDGTVFESVQPGHEIDTLRETFADAIEEEYLKDYPERRPKA